MVQEFTVGSGVLCSAVGVIRTQSKSSSGRGKSLGFLTERKSLRLKSKIKMGST